MSFINKVKNFFYEDIDEVEEETSFKEPKKKEKKREEKFKISFEEPEQKTSQDDLSERELFKSERTFNFPMDIGDNIFDETMKMPKIEEKKEIVKQEKKVSKFEAYRGISSYKPEVKEETKESVRFHPSPVISPVYGILDKNYTVDDVVDKNLSKTKEFSLEKKVVDYDSVRNKAYKDLDEELEKTLTENKDIFYNLDEESTKEDRLDDFDTESEVVITYEDEVEEKKEDNIEEDYEPISSIEEFNKIENEEEEEDFTSPDVEIPVVKKRGRKKVNKEETETKEGKKEDLFNLIDNMYKDDDDEEEDD